MLHFGSTQPSGAGKEKAYQHKLTAWQLCKFIRAGSSYEPPVSGLQHTPVEQTHSEGWTDPEEKSGAESESDLGFDEEEENLPVAQRESASQPESLVAGMAESVEEEEKAPMTVLQKWFPYEAWWQKQVSCVMKAM
jgi:hypothetical protein